MWAWRDAMKRYNLTDDGLTEHADGAWVLWNDVAPLICEGHRYGDQHTQDYKWRTISLDTLTVAPDSHTETPHISTRRPGEEQPHD